MADSDTVETRTHEERPNIVLMVPHDWGRELGAYGRQAHTPRLDDLASEGALFENHFCPSPSCAPSRASLTTGLQPHNHGMLGHPFHSTPAYTDEAATNAKKGWEIHEGIFTLPMYLNRRDYSTYLVNSVHSSKRTLGHRNFPKHPDPTGEPNGARNTADVAESVIEDESDAEDPFYLEIKLNNAHADFSNRDGGFKDDPIPGYEGPAPEEVDLSPYFDSEFDDLERWDEETVRQHFADFYEDMYELDHAVGRILDTLEETGQRENTVFVFTADHGIPWQMAPKSKFTNYDLGIEAGLVMHYPGHVEGGERYDELTSHVDVLPTLLDLVDGRPPVDVDGHSFRPLVDSADDRDYEPRDAVFFETTYNGWGGFYDPVRGIRTEEYKLLRNFWPHDLEASERDQKTEVELYDLNEDPDETVNRADDPAYASVREDLYTRLRERLERDHDPVLEGPIPPKQGAFDVRI